MFVSSESRFFPRMRREVSHCWTRRLSACLVFSLLVLHAFTAVADTASDAEAALDANQRKDYDRAIPLWDRVLASKDLPDDDRSIAYYNRGVAYLLKRKNELGRAIADFDEAIRLEPNFAQAFGYRGAAYYEKRQSEQ